MFSLQGKVAVITGGASGIGKATALRFSKAGARVVVADIQDGSGVAREAGGIYVKTDVGQEDQVKALLKRAVAEFGKLDIVVNNAGIGDGGQIQEITEDEFDRILRVNTKGVLWGLKHAAALISEGGSIINTASYAGVAAFPSYGSYTASKAAVIALTRTAAPERSTRPSTRGPWPRWKWLWPPMFTLFGGSACPRRSPPCFTSWRATRVPLSPGWRFPSTEA